MATDLNTQKQVAIKILKIDKKDLAYSSKTEALRCLQQEVNILHDCSQIKVQSVIEIKDCSFDGTLVKELCAENNKASSSEDDDIDK